MPGTLSGVDLQVGRRVGGRGDERHGRQDGMAFQHGREFGLRRRRHREAEGGRRRDREEHMGSHWMISPVRWFGSYCIDATVC
jgi:hypothetical protein